ncbi:hypothetical protein P175DRAFT_0483038 [Aspergillus ochraceoroseus IBT 24754]|uniref:Enoyl reductase (ER) domain-containing protein n=3 Tax=Aspergillus subgen. Nidulantes TaxID=2720870 RepID=A0A0F8VG11_9EURO|nr:uncharacterized protein P175DRAFT_0483038 [Aspergillus ochraceoroseus IBT 24754]KKK22066.1 hypothetical protein ARAM_002400 [Aspergillus rambellii]KKK25996.1 hypothetical protein AOCH_000453 [Aspergillus ochraceoroseus]PTU19535.1 hypothetical protein P175DRAFT_0483038 [Aspergillus ochraceoroseus IBT 24754]
MSSNKSLVFSKIPDGLPVADVHLKVLPGDCDYEHEPPQGGFIAKVLYASLDPSLRFQLVHPNSPREFPPLPIGSVLSSTSIVKVIRASQDSEFAPDEILCGNCPIQEYIVIDAGNAARFQRIQNPHNLDLKVFLGPLGPPGLTAYSAFYKIGEPKRGQTILVSAASGAVGQLVGQLALKEGLIVIGSAGTDEKVKILKEELGFPFAFNYKKVDILQEIKRVAPGGIDIYYDNVGGQQLEAAIHALNPCGRIVACGYASQYNSDPNEQYGIRNTGLLVGKRIIWRGFLVDIDGEEYKSAHQENVGRWLLDGSLKWIMSETHGIENAAHGLIELFRGDNKGKAILCMD